MANTTNSTNHTRRAVFGFLTTTTAAAGALIALPAAALAASPAGDNPDAELIALAQEWDLLVDEIEAGEKAVEALAVETRFPPRPDALCWRKGDYFGGYATQPGDPMDYHEIERWRRAQRQQFDMCENARAKLIARIEEVVAADDAHMAACDHIRQTTGYSALTQRLDDADARMAAICVQARHARAQTPAGLAIKARFLQRYLASDDFVQDMAFSLAADAITMGAL